MGRWVGDSCWLYFHKILELYSYIVCGFDTVQKDAYNIWIVSNISNRMQQRWNVFFWKALESKFEAIWFSLWRVPGSLGKHNKAQYTTLLPHLNFSPMSPKLFCTYPHIVKNQWITIAALFLRLTSWKSAPHQFEIYTLHCIVFG